MSDIRSMLVLDRLPDGPDTRHAEARAFCLAVIKEFYGTDYRPDWHADLDSLTAEPARSWYSSLSRGAFWTVRDESGAIVATAGLYHLGWKPNIAADLAARYPRPDEVPQLVRVYVRKDQRGRQIGRWLNEIAEAEASRLGYDRLYLHASADAPATIGFWRGRGYGEIAAREAYIHFDKALSNSA